MGKIRNKIILTIAFFCILLSVIVGSISLLQSKIIIGKKANEKLLLMVEKHTNNFNQILSEVELSVDSLATAVKSTFNREEIRSNPDHMDTLIATIDPLVKQFAEKNRDAISAYVIFNPDITKGVYNSQFQKSSD